jgi:hypothetical protein
MLRLDHDWFWTKFFNSRDEGKERLVYGMKAEVI